MIVVFDLDDTLYPEETYVMSGFRAVARYLNQHHHVPDVQVFDSMQAYYHAQGRQGVLEAALTQLDLWTPTRVKQCLSVYRTHCPHIRLSAAAMRCLTRFKRYARYVVTDGNKTVQGNKIRALGLHKRMRHCYATYRYGLKHAKPSPYCFLHIANRERVSPQSVVYIADNPHKDFVGIKPLGFHTIRLHQGPYAQVTVSATLDADWHIQSLDEVTPQLLQHIAQNKSVTV